MVGWLRKRGHIVMNWKTRYFVLNNGFLSYYVDKLDEPPYGKNQKGMLCLAGFRERSTIDEKFYDIAINNQSILSSSAANNNNNNNRSLSTASASPKRSFSIFGGNGARASFLGNSAAATQELR